MIYVFSCILNFVIWTTGMSTCSTQSFTQWTSCHNLWGCWKGPHQCSWGCALHHLQSVPSICGLCCSGLFLVKHIVGSHIVVSIFLRLGLRPAIPLLLQTSVDLWLVLTLSQNDLYRHNLWKGLEAVSLWPEDQDRAWTERVNWDKLSKVSRNNQKTNLPPVLKKV